MGNRESHMVTSHSCPATRATASHHHLNVSRSPSAAGCMSMSSVSAGGVSRQDALSLPSIGKLSSLASSVSSLGLSLAAFGAPLAEMDSPLGSPTPPSPTSHQPSHQPPPQPQPPPPIATEEAAAAAAVALTRPRIHPILRGGRQISQDFYWVLPPRSNKQRCTTATTSTTTSASIVKQQPQHTREAECSTTMDAAAEAEAMPSYRQGRTPLDLVCHVTEQVFGVTDEESYAALSLHHWEPDAAIRYLKVEQLFRLGLADREACRNLLRAHEWRLEAACAAAVHS